MPITATGAIYGNAANVLREAMNRLSDTRALTLKLAEHAAMSQRRNIDERHAPGGAPWKELSDATLQMRGLSLQFASSHGGRGARVVLKGNHANNDAPLKDTGRLYDSIHAEIHANGEGWAGPHALDAWYFSFQNQGTARRGNFRPGESVSPGIPARPFIGISPLLFRVWQADVAEHVNKAFVFTSSAFLM